MMSTNTYPDLRLTIGADNIASVGRENLAVLNPADGSVIGEVPLAAPADLDRALAAASEAFPAWARTAPIERGKVLRRAAQLIRERMDAIAYVLTTEQGKPLAESNAEINHGADVIDWYAEEGRRSYGRIIPASTPDMRYLVMKEPVGVSVAFTPWNFPALTPCRKIGGALAAGCTMILKASEETPGTAVEIVRAFMDAGLPAGVLNLVFGVPAAVSSHLISASSVRKVSFTGSVPVGKELMRLAAEGAKRTTMELGGHSPVIVMDDADIDKAAARLAAAKFRNAGQVCISPTRFYVQDAVYDSFVAKFTAHAKALIVGAGTAPDTTMGPLANERRIAAMEHFIADAERRGARIECGGRRIGNEGFYFEPTVLTDIPDDALIMNEEPFGPIAPITPFLKLNDVVTRANSLPFGLAAYAFTRSNENALKLTAQVKAGMLGLNTMAISSPEAPFGGVKESGQGHEGGIEGLEAYLDTKLVAQSV